MFPLNYNSGAFVSGSSATKGAIQTIFLNLDNLSRMEKFLVDGGYSGKRFANQVKDIYGARIEVVKRSELHKFVVLPRR